MTQKIAGWLESQGYPLEMEVALAFQEAGFKVTLSDLYQDFETGDQREIDVIALHWSDLEKPVALQVCCCIECKMSKDKPWVLFVSEAQRERVPLFELICSRAYLTFLAQPSLRSRVDEALKPLIAFGGGRLGHGLIRAFTPHEDVAHKAILGAVKAGIHRVMRFDSDVLPMQVTKPYFCAVALPIIVIGGRLFECAVARNGDMCLHEIESAALAWRGTNPVHCSPVIRVATRSGLDSLVADLGHVSAALIELTHQNGEKLAEIVRTVRLDTVRPKGSTR